MGTVLFLSVSKRDSPSTVGRPNQAIIAKSEIQFCDTQWRGGIDEGYNSPEEIPEEFYKLASKTVVFGTFAG